MITSRTAADVAVGALCACALAASFPPFNAVWLAPLALAGIFWTWRARSIRSAALLAFAEGALYFTCVFSWFGETVGAYLGPFGFIAGFGPAVIEAPAFAVTAAVAAAAARTIPRALVPLAAALAFALCEALRSSGTLGVPFGTLAEPLAATWLAALAALAGGTAITLAVAVVAAYLASAIEAPPRGMRALGIAVAAVALATGAAGAVWPAKTVGAPSIPVAAIQGNIRQDIKWNPATLAVAVDRYIALTHAAAPAHPRIVVWPESVITTFLNADPALRARFAALARDLHATLAVGTDERDASGLYDSLYYFGPTGTLDAVYRKRRLVPFAEYLPAEGVLHDPIVAVERAAGIADPILPSSFTAATADAVIDAGGVRTAPLICWESGFADLTQTQIDAGAQALIVATDDAWFGETGGPYQHAQLAQLRAIETGRWVVRAAATGISGIIAPDGRFTRESTLDTQAVEAGEIGLPQPTVFSRIGTRLPIVTLVLALAGLFAFRRAAGFAR